MVRRRVIPKSLQPQLRPNLAVPLSRCLMWVVCFVYTRLLLCCCSFKEELMALMALSRSEQHQHTNGTDEWGNSGPTQSFSYTKQCYSS